MIIKHSHKRPRRGQLKQVVKFAFLPTRTIDNDNYHTSEWIWLERFVTTYKFCLGDEIAWWDEIKKERFSEAVLEKFES